MGFYTVALIGWWLALRFVGEAWWPTTILLYTPRSTLALPLPFLAVAVLAVGPRRLLPPLLFAAAWLFVTLDGFSWARPESDPGAPVLRILSLNLGHGADAAASACPEVVASDPDVIVFQSFNATIAPILEPCLAPYATRHVEREFVLATRFPLVRFAAPPRTPSRHRPGFVEYGLDTPLGPIDLFNIHPVSPRGGFEDLAAGGGVLSPDAGSFVQANTEHRREQLAALVAALQRAAHPVLVAGDTNLPAASRLFAETLGSLQDGFQQAGRGFGYTFPADRPWMRIDRVLAGPELRFTGFRVGRHARTTHRAVVAELQRRPELQPSSSGPSASGSERSR